MSVASKRDLVFLILQFLEEENYLESVHRLEKESGYFFNTQYFDEKFLAGEWDEIDKYLSGFTKVDDNEHSMKIFFEIRKQKYFEALDRQDRAKAVEILYKDLGFVSTYNVELHKELTLLLALPNFRLNQQLSKYSDAKTARKEVLRVVRKLIKGNSLFREKLVHPTLSSSSLRTLINQSLNREHQLHSNPRPNPNGSKSTVYPSLGALGPFPGATPGALANIMDVAYDSAVETAVFTPTSLFLPQNQVPLLKRRRAPPATPGIVDYQNLDHEPTKRHRSAPWSLEDLPTKTAIELHQGSTVTSMDFHPMQNTLLLVGSVTGEIALREIVIRKMLSMPFKTWDMAKCSNQFQELIRTKTPISVTRVAWSQDGNFIGVAFSKHLIHLYAFSAPYHLRQHIEVESHVGAVNDLAFAYPDGRVYVVTCGDDKLVKVWDISGQKHFTFEGHDAPVYSVCPHQKNNMKFIFSTAIDGKIKVWLYDNMGSRVEYDAPGKWCTTMLYSADETRLFSCGSSKDGDSFLAEWNVIDGAIIRTYIGFRKKGPGVVQFDSSKNQFLAVGEDEQIKFWDMDDINVLTSTDAEGGLPAHPHLRFNKEGNLLAVSTANEGFKILANQAGFKSLEVVPGSPVASVSSPVRPSPILNGVDHSKSRIDQSVDKPKPWQLPEILDPSRCRQVTLPETTGSSTKVIRLLYLNSGVGILALGFNGIQRLWKWVRNEQNLDGKATTTVVPELWEPKNGLLMTNNVSLVNLEGATPCIALSNNDTYVMSAVGGKVSLFNLVNFKVMTTFMPPPPASTYLAFNPLDNNIIAIGMDNATIHIYNARTKEVRSILTGHKKCITGLAFSTTLNILVSSGADEQLSFWSIDTWEKRKSIAIQIPAGSAAKGDTRIQFHVDQIHILAVHETQLAIVDASKMKCIRQWIPQDSLSAPISSAVFSCNSQLIYTAFRDGNIGVFDGVGLRLKCRIAPSAYSPQGSQGLSPLVVAANPQDPNQFAVGLNDGSVMVIEPTEAEAKWGMDPTCEAINTPSSSSTTRSQTSKQFD